MYARSSTIHAQPASIDAGIAAFRDEILPPLRDMDGFVGASLIVDRESGTCIVTANWATAEARQASAEMVRPLRDRAAARFGADSVEVAEWEIAGMHREQYSGEGACVRTTWLRTDPAEIDRAVDAWKTQILPALGTMDGFCSASMMVDRGSGRAVGSATFASRASLDSSREPADRLRSAVAQAAGGEVADVQEFELAVAHLHEPEMV